MVRLSLAPSARLAVSSSVVTGRLAPVVSVVAAVGEPALAQRPQPMHDFLTNKLAILIRHGRMGCLSGTHVPLGER
jgi:hypothetical protein